MRQRFKYLLIACCAIIALAFSNTVEAGNHCVPSCDTQSNDREKIESFNVTDSKAILVNVQPTVVPTFVNVLKKQRNKRNIFNENYSFQEEEKHTQSIKTTDLFEPSHIKCQYPHVNDFYVYALRRIVI